MNLIDLVILSIALGVDCLIVSFCQGLVLKENKRINSAILGLSMGFFQGFMPCISYFFTDFVDEIIEPFGKWIVFTIFMCLAFKVFVETFYGKEECNDVCYIDLKNILFFSIATSIDALASGVNLKLTNTPILTAAIIIGVGSFIMSGLGFWLGYFFKKLPSKILGIMGCLILVFLAIKAL